MESDDPITPIEIGLIAALIVVVAIFIGKKMGWL